MTTPAQFFGARLPPRLAPLANRDVACYLIARLLWVSATQIGNVAVGWLVYEVTRSAWALGFVGLAAFAPKLVLMLVSGIVADRYDRRLVTATCMAANGLATLGLVFVALSTPVWIGAIYALFILSGTARGFALPATQAMIANLVPREEFSRAIGLSSAIGQFAAIGGPALGGLLYVFGAWVPFAVATAFFLGAAVLNLLIRPIGTDRPTTPVRLADAFAGLAFIWQRPVILGAISLDLFAVLLGGATALLPIIAVELLHAGPVALGILRAMPAVGALTLGLIVSYLPIRRDVGFKLFASTAVFGLATIGLGLSTSMLLSMAFLFVIGASDVFSVVIRQTLVQSDTPDAMRGRVAAVNSLFIGASNELGEFESGATAALFGLVPAIILGGAGTVVVCGLWAWLFPALRRRDELVDPRGG